MLEDIDREVWIYKDVKSTDDGPLTNFIFGSNPCKVYVLIHIYMFLRFWGMYS
jgi:hypothetical protein